MPFGQNRMKKECTSQFLSNFTDSTEIHYGRKTPFLTPVSYTVETCRLSFSP